MNKAILTLSLAILLLVTASCSDVVDEPQPVEYYQSLLDGKTKAEIKEILGPPDSEVVYGHGGPEIAVVKFDFRQIDHLCTLPSQDFLPVIFS